MLSVTLSKNRKRSILKNNCNFTVKIYVVLGCGAVVKMVIFTFFGVARRAKGCNSRGQNLFLA
jgi:hypothetical protein